MQQPGFFHGTDGQLLIEDAAAGFILPDGQGALPVGPVQAHYFAVDFFAQGVEIENLWPQAIALTKKCKPPGQVEIIKNFNMLFNFIQPLSSVYLLNQHYRL